MQIFFLLCTVKILAKTVFTYILVHSLPVFSTYQLQVINVYIYIHMCTEMNLACYKVSFFNTNFNLDSVGIVYNRVVLFYRIRGGVMALKEC